MKTQLLQELNQFSLNITNAIESNDWEQLLEILIKRQARLEQLLNAPLSEAERQTIQSVLQSIEAMDKLFIDSVEFKKNELLKDFQSVVQGQKGIKAYYENSTN